MRHYRAAIDPAMIMTRAKIANRQPGFARKNSLANELANHAYEHRMSAYRRRANHADTQLPSEPCGLRIEVVEDLQMV